MLPWRLGWVRYVRMPDARSDVQAVVEDALAKERRAGGPSTPMLVAVTGASNVTGDVCPVEDLAWAASRQGARVFVDGARSTWGCGRRRPGALRPQALRL